MAEFDAFDTRFAAAYRAYLDEVPVEVDAAAVAREVARARGVSSRRVLGRRYGRMTLAAWLVVLAALVLASLAIVAGAGGLRHPEPASDLPAGMAGTWYYEHDDGTPYAKDTRTIAITDCAFGETCGRLVIRDEAGRRCEYTLTLRDLTGAGAVLEIGPGTSFECAWSPWPGSMQEVRLIDATTLEIGAVPLRRVGGAVTSAAPASRVVGEVSDPRDVPRGNPDISHVTVRLDQDQVLLEIELVRPVPDGVHWWLRGFLDPDRTGSCNAWVAAYALDVEFVGGAETKGARLRYEPESFGAEWFGTPGRTKPETYELVTHIAGPWATVWIPLELLADPKELGFMLFTTDGTPVTEEDLDTAAGGPASSNFCLRVSLTGG